jgi:hypothetical protein
MIVVEGADCIGGSFGLIGGFDIVADFATNSDSDGIGGGELGIVSAVIDRREHGEETFTGFECDRAGSDCGIGESTTERGQSD